MGKGTDLQADSSYFQIFILSSDLHYIIHVGRFGGLGLAQITQRTLLSSLLRISPQPKADSTLN